MGESDAIVGLMVNQTRLPRDALVSVIVRDDEALLPRGSTEIEAGDRLHILVRGQVRDSVEDLFDRWRDGPPRRAEPSVPSLAGRPLIFSVRPWRTEMGDPAHPEHIDGVEVRKALRTRREQAGALLLLADGRLAATGDGVVAVGGARQLFRYCRERIERADSAQARAWWQEGRRRLADDRSLRRRQSAD